MLNKTFWFVLITLIVSSVYAEITLSGDARLRPRFDVKDNGEYGTQSEDFYYYYRARLMVNADIGDGYFFNTRLGHNGATYWIGKFGSGDTPSSLSNPNAGRGSVDFMELYFGHKGKKFGWSGGIIPIPHNPILDIHYYPNIILDKAWDTYNNNAAHGFDFNYKLAGKPLDIKILVDNNDGRKVVDANFVSQSDTSIVYIIDQDSGSIRLDTSITSTASSASNTRDQYTVYLSYPVSLIGFKMTPHLLVTLSDKNKAAPITYGLEFKLPRVAGFGLSAFGGLTSQAVSDSLTNLTAYNGWIARVKMVGKLGPGTLVAWYDQATTTPDVTDAVDSKFSYLWLSYTYTLHKSDWGSMVFAPTYRLYTNKIEGSRDYTRAKIELTTEIKFK
ncbi:MAG: hypothetical protein HQ556_09375 [Candidatus Marinimicrobia bacterium]|nr:hypothetical protein [Candidatus Neomarinimicrobiota bacterium]